MGRHSSTIVRHARSLLWISILAAILALTPGCGDEDEPVSGCRVRILTSDADGPVDAPLFLEGAGARRFPLEPVEGGEPGEMFAAGAPDGPYQVSSEGAWGMLWVAPRLPFLAAKATTAYDIPMGRGRTIYVGARDRDRGRVGAEWRVRRADGDRHPVEIEILPAFFEMQMLRIPPDEYRGRLEIAGRMSDGSLVRPFEQNVGNPDRPLIVLAQSAYRVLVTVRLVDMRGPPRGTELVALELLDTPLPERVEVRSEQGFAAFPATADLDTPIRIHLDGQKPPWSFDVPAEDVDRLGLFYVHTLPLDPTEPTRPTRLTGPRANDVDLVQVRGPDGEAYGRVSLRARGDAAEVVVEPGKQRWLVRAGAEWALLDVDIPKDGERSVEIEGLEPGAVAHGTVMDLLRDDEAPVGPGHRLLFLRVEGEGEDENLFLGEELDVAASPHGLYEARLPAGVYDVRVMRPHGALGKAVRIEARSGVTLSRDFEIDE